MFTVILPAQLCKFQMHSQNVNRGLFQLPYYQKPFSPVQHKI